MNTAQPHHLVSTAKALLIAVVLGLGLLGSGIQASAATPPLISMRDTGGSGAGSGLVSGVAATPAPRPEVGPVCRLPE